MLRDVAVARVKLTLGFRTDQDANIVTAMIEVQDELERDAELPFFLRKEYSPVLQTTANNANVSLPSDFLREDDSAQFYITETVNNEEITSPIVKDEYLNNLLRFSNVGKPRKYAIVAKTMKLSPIPDKVYDINGFYYAKAADLSTNIENLWLEYLPEIIISKAGVLIASALNNDKALQIFAAMQTLAQTKLVSMTASSDAAGAKPVAGGED